MKRGTVKEYDRDKGYGFITGNDDEDYFVHVNGLGANLRNRGLRRGQRVKFDVMFDVKGDSAVNVRLE
ncbi:MAG: cold shock domain-containing protein [Candidatus Neomarinimicrobiota bacterium]